MADSDDVFGFRADDDNVEATAAIVEAHCQHTVTYQKKEKSYTSLLN